MKKTKYNLKTVFTPADVIAWLKRQRKSAKFTWMNAPDQGCLFSRFVQYALPGNRNIHVGGLLSAKNGESEPRATHQAIPFHDEFWNVNGLFPGHWNVTRNEAIAILQKLSQKES